MSQIIAGRYEIQKLIGKGGMADVYLALDTILNRQVAIKILRSDMANDSVAVERFAREANASTKLSHPNIVEIYDVGDEDDMHYIVMEYVKGLTLKQLLSKRGAIPYKEAVWMMKQLSGALLEAHKNGIIHRDIKSQNVLIKDDGTIKMADFGIAVLHNSSQLTGRNVAIGSVHYLAPELSKGGSASMQSDIYSLGIVFYELLTGDVPFKGDTPVSVAVQHVHNSVPFVKDINPEIPQAVENIIIKATARNLDERYTNVAYLIRDLNECLNSDVSERIQLKDFPGTETRKKDQEETIEVGTKSKRKKKNGKKGLAVPFILMITLFSAIMIILILYLCGIIGKGNKYTAVPDIHQMTIVDAADLLDQSYLSLDYSQIERVMTDDIEAGLIISYSPDGEKVEKGTKIKVVVSEGKYLKMDNYIGKDIEEISPILKEMNFIIEKNPVESDEPSGTILTQEGTAPGDKYNPNISNPVIFTYSEYHSISIPFFLIGRNVDEVYQELSSHDVKVKKQQINIDELSEEERMLGAGNVVRIDPPEGTYFTQEDENKIILYYY